jgi:hypothetical protein
MKSSCRSGVLAVIVALQKIIAAGMPLLQG